MKIIILTGWREGLQPVALVGLQRELLHLSLKEAKENVDRLLAVEAGMLPPNPVMLQVPEEVAVEFFTRANELGALGRFSVIGASKHSTASKAAA